MEGTMTNDTNSHLRYPHRLSMKDRPATTSRHVWVEVVRAFNRGPTETEARAVSKEFRKHNEAREKAGIPKTTFEAFTARGL